MEDIPYTTPEGFLELFDVDTATKGARDFCELVRRAALLQRFPEYHVGCYKIALYDMSTRHTSPLVYWSNMRRAIAPAVEAGRDTLRALMGFSVPGDGEVTVYALASALSGSLALLTADWYRRLAEEHTQGDSPDDVYMPVIMAQEADREEAARLFSEITAHKIGRDRRRK